MDTITQFLTQLLSPQGGDVTIVQAITALFVAYLGGVLSSLTPCVYPMIPITISVVGGTTEVPLHGGQASGELRRRPWKDILLRSFVYVSGMTVVYAVLGVLAGLTGKVFGSFTNTSTWYIGLGMIMSVSALIMTETIPFDPKFWWEQLKYKIRHIRGRPHPTHSPVLQKEITLLGAFTLGASSGFIASPCTTPVLTAILAYIAKTQSIGLGLGLMFSFSLGLGTLLLTIAAFTGALQILPKSGNWMKTVKLASGLLLLAFGEYLIYRGGKMGGP